MRRLAALSSRPTAADGSGGWDYVRDTTTNATSGSYVLKALPTGDYRIGFRDDSGIYAPEFFDDQLTIEAGEDVPVNAPDVTSGIDAELAVGGHISGTVTDEDAVGLANMKVSVYESVYYHHMGWSAGWALTDEDGSYDIGGLAEGISYLVEFTDDAGFYATQYFDDVAAPTSAAWGRGVRQRDDRPASTPCSRSPATSRGRSRTRAPSVSTSMWAPTAPTAWVTGSM